MWHLTSKTELFYFDWKKNLWIYENTFKVLYFWSNFEGFFLIYLLVNHGHGGDGTEATSGFFCFVFGLRVNWSGFWSSEKGGFPQTVSFRLKVSKLGAQTVYKRKMSSWIYHIGFDFQESERRIRDNQMAKVQRKVPAISDDRRPARRRVISHLGRQIVSLGQVLRPFVQRSHALPDSFDSQAAGLGQCDCPSGSQCCRFASDWSAWPAGFSRGEKSWSFDI